jgi:signal-transduction protein with cAMP-binding, CBS, and nucleotidyltransferase domain
MTILPETSLIEALKKMSQEKVTRLLVMRGDQMMGMITQTGLLRFLEIKRALANEIHRKRDGSMAREGSSRD